jgi:DNA-binding transcriptional LysR family regulator
MISNYALPQMLAVIRQRHPAVAIELVPSDSAENLLLREADIAVRMFRPTQLELVTRHIGEIPVVGCAHQSYLARRGTPRSLAELAGHDLIGFDRDEFLVATARAMGLPVRREDFGIRTDSQTAMWELIKAGLGIGFAQAPLVAGAPGMVRLFPDLAFPPLEIWLTTHRELFTSRRIRAIYDALAERLAAYLKGL